MFTFLPARSRLRALAGVFAPVANPSGSACRGCSARKVGCSRVGGDHLGEVRSGFWRSDAAAVGVREQPNAISKLEPNASRNAKTYPIISIGSNSRILLRDR